MCPRKKYRSQLHTAIRHCGATLGVVSNSKTRSFSFSHQNLFFSSCERYLPSCFPTPVAALLVAAMGNHHETEIKEVTEVSEEDAQEFFDSASNGQNDDIGLLAGTEINDGIPDLPSPGHFDLSHTSPLIANYTSCILSEEENRVLDDKIDRLIAAIGDGRQLDFTQDLDIGDVDISAMRRDDDSDAGSLEKQIASHPNNFGNIIRTRRRRNLRESDTSMVTIASTSGATSGTNAWERAIAAADIRYALRALEPGSAARDGTVIRMSVKSVEEIARKDGGRYLTFMGKKGPEVCAISPIPLSFASPPGFKTPSIHSTGSELDSSSPLFGKSAQVWLRKPQGGLYSVSLDSTDARITRLKESITTWLESVEHPSRSAVPKRVEKPEGAFGVFNDEDASRDPVSKQVSGDNPGAEALKDISNLRRPGYLQHNSFAKPTLSSAAKERAVLSQSSTGAFGGAVDRDSRRDFIQSKWPGLLPRNEATTVPEVPESSKERRSENENPPQPMFTAFDTTPAHQRLKPDPVRAAYFELALARLEGRAPPGQYSPPKRYADRVADYGSSVELEHQPWNVREPKPSRPFVKVSEQVVNADSQEDRPRTDWDELEERERTVGLSQ